MALVGTGGSGKSSVVNLLMRFYDPDAGSVTADGTDLRRVAQEGLRQRISLLSATSVFFSASIKENIRLG